MLKIPSKLYTKVIYKYIIEDAYGVNVITKNDTIYATSLGKIRFKLDKFGWTRVYDE